jgi:hypothetical protein
MHANEVHSDFVLKSVIRTVELMYIDSLRGTAEMLCIVQSVDT